MPRIHEQFDGDRVAPGIVMDYRSMTNRFEIPCNVCGRSLYVGESTAREIERSIEHGLDLPLTCSECERNIHEFEDR